VNDDNATLVEWKVKTGDAIKSGDTVCVVETTKTTWDVPAETDGVIVEIVAAPGDVVDVGGLLCHLAGGDGVAAIASAAATAPTTAPASVRATDAAIATATRLGVDLRDVKATGVIRESDVLRHLDQKPATVSATSVAPANSILASAAQRALIRSLRSGIESCIPTFIAVDADVAATAKALVEFSESADVMIGIAEAIVWAAVRMLSEFPEINGFFDPQHQATVLRKNVNLGLATDVDGQLIVPVIREAETLSMIDLAERMQEAYFSAMRHELGSRDVAEPTFSVSNLLPYGVSDFVPLIGHRQAATLGLCKGPMHGETPVRICMAYDHQVLAGGRAARFLNRIIDIVAGPDLMQHLLPPTN
jgi:2-oxoglutarate dehydrogenase E2 component (dihydrolipoamide succinyltransferase)